MNKERKEIIKEEVAKVLKNKGIELTQEDINSLDSILDSNLPNEIIEEKLAEFIAKKINSNMKPMRTVEESPATIMSLAASEPKEVITQNNQNMESQPQNLVQNDYNQLDTGMFPTQTNIDTLSKPKTLVRRPPVPDSPRSSEIQQSSNSGFISTIFILIMGILSICMGTGIGYLVYKLFFK